MAETHHKKKQITAALTALRIQMQNEASLLRRKLDTKQRFLESIKIIRGNGPAAQPFSAGCCLAFLARKKRIYIDSSSEKPVKRRDKGLLRKLWRKAWQFSKPMIAAYLAKLLAENAKVPQRK
jgi:hypothetical protein